MSSPLPLTVPASQPLWFKDAVIYQLHVKTFADNNGDGIGDFQSPFRLPGRQRGIAKLLRLQVN